MAETNAPEGLTLADLDDKLFTQIAAGCGLKLKSWKQLEIGDSSEDGLTSVMATAADNDKELEGILTGICYFEITGTSLHQESDCEVKKKVALKAKLSPLQTAMSLASVFAMSYEKSEEEILEILASFSTGALSSAKEIEVARWSFSEKAAASIMPMIYYTECDKTTPYFVMEYFEPEIMENIDTLASKFWTKEKRFKVLRDIANLHATYLGRTERLDGTKIKPHLSDLSAALVGAKKLWDAGLTVTSRQHPDIVTHSRVKLLHSIIDNLASEVGPYLSQFPQTVVHGDLHAGNLCLRKNPSNGESHLCAYDWEFCSLHVPQRDFAYFLISTLPVMESASEHLALWQEYTDFFRNELIAALKRAGNVSNPHVEKFLQKETFQKIADYAIIESATDLVILTGSIPVAFALASWDETAGNALLYIEAVKDQYKFLQN